MLIEDELPPEVRDLSIFVLVPSVISRSLDGCRSHQLIAELL
jgi:hypothetical protein